MELQPVTLAGRHVRRVPMPREEGVFRKHGVTEDTVWYSIVDGGWPSVRARLEELLARP